MECMCVWLATVLERAGLSSLSPWKVGRGEVKVCRGRFILAYKDSIRYVHITYAHAHMICMYMHVNLVPRLFPQKFFLRREPGTEATCT